MPIARPIAMCVIAAIGCGTPPARDARALRAELRDELAAARTAAGPVVEEAEAALADAEAAEAVGDVTAAAEHRARARLIAARATAEAEARRQDEARGAIDAETEATLTEALAIETEAESIERDASRLAAARAAREEALRALTRAEADEARGRRRIHLSLDDEAAMRGAARDIRRRARLLAAAATAMAARRSIAITGELADVEGHLAASEAATDGLEALREADAAHAAARALLGVARRGAPIETAAITSLLEACASEGFEAVQLERGVAIDVSEALGAGRAPSRDGAARLARLAQLIASHPEGPVLLEVRARGAAGTARAEALTTALVDGGLARERLDARVEDEEPMSARVVLVAYAMVSPPTAARILRDEVWEEMAARRASGEPSSAGVSAHPTPSSTEE